MPNPTTRKLPPMSDVKPTEGKVTPPKTDSGTKPAATPAKPVETKTEPGHKTVPLSDKPNVTFTEDEFDWADLAPATEEPAGSKFSRGTKIDINKEIPEPIRNDVEEAFKKDGKYVLKTCATPEQADRFTKLAKRYAKYRVAGQITVRGGPTKLDPKVVRFNAKPLETRASSKDDAGEGKPKATSK